MVENMEFVVDAATEETAEETWELSGNGFRCMVAEFALARESGGMYSVVYAMLVGQSLEGVRALGVIARNGHTRNNSAIALSRVSGGPAVQYRIGVPTKYGGSFERGQPVKLRSGGYALAFASPFCLVEPPLAAADETEEMSEEAKLSGRMQKEFIILPATPEDAPEHYFSALWERTMVPMHLSWAKALWRDARMASHEAEEISDGSAEAEAEVEIRPLPSFGRLAFSCNADDGKLARRINMLGSEGRLRIATG